MKLQYLGKQEINKIHTKFSESMYDKRTFEDDITQNKPDDGNVNNVTNPTSIWFNKDGTELITPSPKIRVQSVYNENIIGYLIAQSNTFELAAAMTILNRGTAYNGNGFHLRADNFLEKLPLFAAGWWSTYNDDWTLNGVVYRCGDGLTKFNKALLDKDQATLRWLDRILFYTCLEYYNKIRSLNGSDGRLYKNELCLDNNIDHSEYVNKQMKSLEKETLAYNTLKNHKFFDEMNEEEKELLFIWNKILKNAKLTSNYNPEFNYGPFQIEQELNTFYYEEVGKTKKKVFDYPELNGDLKTLRVKIKEYYKKYIEEYLFKYEFLK